MPGVLLFVIMILQQDVKTKGCYDNQKIILIIKNLLSIVKLRITTFSNRNLHIEMPRLLSLC